MANERVDWMPRHALEEEVTKLRSEVAAYEKRIPELCTAYLERIDALEVEVTKARAERKEMHDLIKRLLQWPEMHEQRNPEWNGNRFDDIKAAREALEKLAL
jgi:hypothetical protein